MSIANRLTHKLVTREIARASLTLQQARAHHPDPFNPKVTKGWKAALKVSISNDSFDAFVQVHSSQSFLIVKEAEIPRTKFDEEIAHALEFGLPGASSLEDKTIPTFSRGELPHFAGINTFLKAPYVEDARQVGMYDCAVVGVPFDGGCTYRPGTRFGPQGIRRISALYTPYNYEKGIDLREQMVNRHKKVTLDFALLCFCWFSLRTLFRLFAISATSSRFLPILKSRLIRFQTLLHISLPRELCPSSWEVTIRSVFPPFVVSHLSRQRTSESSTWIDMPIFKKKILTRECTQLRTSTPQTCPTSIPRTWCRLALAGGRFRARRLPIW